MLFFSTKNSAGRELNQTYAFRALSKVFLIKEMIP